MPNLFKPSITMEVPSKIISEQMRNEKTDEKTNPQ